MFTIKYINPIFNMPHVTKFMDAYISHDLDEDGNKTSDYVLMINCSNEYKYCLCIQGASFSKLNEFINEIYDTGKLDISTNPDIKISAYPKLFESSLFGSMSDDEDDEDCGIFNDLYNDLSDFLDEDYYND